MMVEMRTYKVKPGRRAEFLETFESKVRPDHEKIGMKILGPFLSIDDADIFFWMRAFPDLASRDRKRIMSLFSRDTTSFWSKPKAVWASGADW
jgi:hypothetical protein